MRYFVKIFLVFLLCGIAVPAASAIVAFSDDFNDNDISDWTKTINNNAGAIADNGRMRLQVYKCSDVDVYKDLGFISGEITVDFDWQTQAEGWWEVTGWKLIVDGALVVDEGIPVRQYGGYAGHVTRKVNVSGDVRLVYRIYQSSWCWNYDHYNTYLWVDNVVVNLSDEIPPETAIILNGTGGLNGWYISDVQVTLTATDNVGGAGVKNTEYSLDSTNWNLYTVPFAIINEGTNSVYYRSTDNAGNVEPIKNQTIKIDKTTPTITGTPTTSPNANGWYNNDVIVHFTASDAVSGVDTITPDITISTEGTGQSVTGTATDKAGNSASTTVSGINIDKNLPQITINTPANGGVYILNQTLVADWSSADSLSGLASATGTLPSGAAIDTSTVGLKTFTVTATDNASNTATQTASYTISYNFPGILPPVRTDGSSIFKLGSTVPVKFRIADANGNYVSIAVANLTYQKITDDILGTIEEAVSTSEANEGNTFRYDSADNLYIFNLGTNGMTAGTYQLNINLDDGTVHTVRISLR
jgi:hypothetical protein